MSEFVAGYGMSDSAEADGWAWVAEPASAGRIAPDVSADPVGHRAEPALVEAIIGEIPSLKRYAAFLTRNATEKDDLVQDCLERALTKAGQFQPGTDLRRWLFVILRNLFIDGKRKEARRNREVPIIDRDCLTSLSPQYFNLRLKEVEAAIRELRPYEREIIYLSLVVGLDQRTIARQMNIAVGTVKSRLARARQKLRQED